MDWQKLGMSWQKLGGGALIFITVAGFTIGSQSILKANAAKDIKAQLVGACDQDQACLSSVNAHFDTCFNDSYSLGGRRRAGRLDGNKFATCLNQKAGKDYFSSEK
jgi:hypothetical protein